MHFITAMAQAQVGNQSAAQTEVERTLQLCPQFEQFFGRTHLQKWIQNQPDLLAADVGRRETGGLSHSGRGAASGNADNGPAGHALTRSVARGVDRTASSLVGKPTAFPGQTSFRGSPEREDFDREIAGHRERFFRPNDDLRLSLIPPRQLRTSMSPPVVPWPSEGKSTLINHWLRGMAAEHYRSAKLVFGWSVLSTRQQRGNFLRR